MKRFILNTNTEKDPDLKITRKVKDQLEKYGAEVTDNPEHADAMIVFGGDGTLLHSIHDYPHLPVLGINLGTLGFLTEFEVNDTAAIGKIARGEYIIEKRMMLEGRIGGGKPFFALNDIVMSRGGAARIMTMKLYVDECLADTYSADGIIAATPTGSTAYSLSAGGPVVEPDIELIGVTPICPHSMHARSLMVSHKRTVRVELVEKSGQYLHISADGMTVSEISGGSSVSIRKADTPLELIRLKNHSFYDVLNKKQELR